jgi:CheY-like chemotaxis protein
MPGTDGLSFAEQVRNIGDLRHIPIFMLSSGAGAGDRKRCKELNIAAYFSKPVDPSELFDALLSNLAKIKLKTTDEIAEPHPLEELGPGLKVLLVEDNAVNRLLVRKLLEKHGHKVILAENGRQAIDAIAREVHDLVLMDVQMPVMDGLEAMRIIRASEQSSGQHLPIIALTAHAMKGDRERCLDAGADDYLTKPIRTTELFAAVARIKSPLSKPAAPIIQTAEGAPSSLPAVFDLPAALERIGDKDTLEELARLFTPACQQLMDEIRHALAASNGDALLRAAHTLQGSSASLGAPGIARASQELQKLASSEHWIAAQAVFAGLEIEVNRLYVELSTLLHTVPC